MAALNGLALFSDLASWFLARDTAAFVPVIAVAGTVWVATLAFMLLGVLGRSVVAETHLSSMLEEGRFQCPCCDYLHSSSARELRPLPGVLLGGRRARRSTASTEVSGPNHITLREARRNFTDFGACDQAALGLVAPASERVGLRRELRDEMR